MKSFDLHCDTLACSNMDGRNLRENDGQLDLTRGARLGTWVQTFACFLPSDLRGEEAHADFLSQVAVFEKALADNPDLMRRYETGVAPKEGMCNAILSIEGGTAIGGKLENIEKCKQLGVSYFTLVWNGDNEIAHGVGGEDKGLTDFGKEAVRELERCNIIVDISHLNDKGMADVFAMATKPIMATHSNIRSVHEHFRNLTDEEFRFLVDNGGLCGINYYTEFINGKPDYTPEDFHRHLDRMLELGGKDIIALGSDFDGADMPPWLNKVEKLADLYRYVTEWYGTELADKVFFENAYTFTEKNVKIH